MPTPSLILVPARFKTGKLYTPVATTSGGLVLGASGDFNVTRATTATRVNASGLIESVASGIPRLDYFASGGVVGCPALLVEPSATNQIRNNSASGAVTGTPGTLPTNWSVVGNALGLSGEITATGVENGIPYLDYKITGTATSSADRALGFETTSQIVASSGQIWTNSFYAKIVSAPNPPTQYVATIFERNAAGGFLSLQQNTVTIGSSLTRVQRVGSALGATTERVQPAIGFSVVSGSTYNFTVRIGYPQMELGSVATSVIPTTNATVTRNADVISVSGAVSGCIGQTEGTIYWEGDASLVSGAQDILFINRNVTNSVILVKTGANLILTQVYASGTLAFQIADSIVRTGFIKLAIAYKSGNSTFYINGTRVGTLNTTAFTFTAALNTIIFGENTFISGRGDQRCRAVAIYTTRLSDTELAALTTL